MRAAEASMVMPATADVVFATVTDIGRLPEWNARITSVVEAPAALTIGAQWVVELHALGQTWRSRSTLEDLDVPARRFAYRAMTDDGNPSYAQWTWTVAETSSGSRATVAWTLHPATFWRRVLLARIRARQLARTELPASLAALASLVASAPGVKQADTERA
jgi:uncharacterized protein YndB with AHSA1/START domain